MEMTFDLPTSWRHGRGIASRVGDILTDLGCRKPLLLTDELLLKQNIIEPVVTSLNNANIAYEVNADIAAEPTLRLFQSLVDKLDLKSFDAIVAVGGGSVLDVAKGLAVMATFGGDIRDYAGFNKVPRVPDQKIITIPTTSGTGSEISDGVVLIDEERQTKFLVISKLICPTMAITDPELTRGMPPWVTTCSGIDALVHATESYISKNATVVTELFALKAIEMLSRGFKPALVDGNDLDARESMQIGATMAMTAGMNSYLGLCHAMAMPLCALYHMPHGQACGMMLPAVLQYNAGVKNDKVVTALKTMQLNNDKAGDDATVDAAYEKLDAFLKDIGIAIKLSGLGYQPEHMQTIVKETLASAQAPSNPRIPTEEDIARIVDKVI